MTNVGIAATNFDAARALREYAVKKHLRLVDEETPWAETQVRPRRSAVVCRA